MFRTVFQTVGGAFTVSAAQAAFINQMLAKLAMSASDVDPSRLIAVGASELRSAFKPEQLPEIIAAYMQGLKAVFAVSIGLCVIAFLTTLIIPWSTLPTHVSDAAKGEERVIVPV